MLGELERGLATGQEAHCAWATSSMAVVVEVLVASTTQDWVPLWSVGTLSVTMRPDPAAAKPPPVTVEEAGQSA